MIMEVFRQTRLYRASLGGDQPFSHKEDGYVTLACSQVGFQRRYSVLYRYSEINVRI